MINPAEVNAIAKLANAMSASFLLQVTSGLPNFNGQNIPLQDFVTAIEGAAKLIDVENEKTFTNMVIRQLQGRALRSTVGKAFQTPNDLIKHLKQRFAPNLNYEYYMNKIANLKMDQTENVGDFHDELNILLYEARILIRDENPDQSEENIKQIAKPLEKIAIRTYIRGLPADIALAVRNAKPQTLGNAYREAVDMEMDMENGTIPDTRKYSEIFSVNSADKNIVNFYDDPNSTFKNISLKGNVIHMPVRNKIQGNPGTTLHNMFQALKNFIIDNGLSCSNIHIDPHAFEQKEISADLFNRVITKVFKNSNIAIDYM